MRFNGSPLNHFAADLATLGLFPTVRSVLKFGQCSDTDGLADVWNGGASGGGVYTGIPNASADTLDVVSSSPNDDPASTGAWTVLLEGLDDDFNEIIELVTLDGTNPVTTVQAFRRMNRARVITTGSGGFNAGEITARHTSTGANVFMVMPANRNQTHIAAYTVPAGWRGIIKSVSMSLQRDAGGTFDREASIDVLVREEVGGPLRSKFPRTITTSDDLDSHFASGIVVPEKGDLVARVWSVSNANSVVSAEIEVRLFRM